MDLASFFHLLVLASIIACCVLILITVLRRKYSRQARPKKDTAVSANQDNAKKLDS